MSARQRNNPRNRGMTLKDRPFHVNILVEATGEIFPMKKVHGDLLMRELKIDAEFITGVPASMQRLTYLDEGDMLDDSDIKSNSIVSGGQICMKVWNVWKTLLEAVAGNDVDWLFRLGIKDDGIYTTPNLEYMTKRNREAFIADRAFVALYLAAHRGNMRMCRKLIDAGANVNACTSLGRTALHVAAAKGNGNVLDMLLANGADIHAEDGFGESALTIAEKYGHKECARRLFMFRWQDRAKSIVPMPEMPLFAHQYYDSKLPVWLNGDKAQLYFTKFMPAGEYSGTHLSAPKNEPVVTGQEKWKDWREGAMEEDGDLEEDMQTRRIRPKSQSLSDQSSASALSTIREENSKRTSKHTTRPNRGGSATIRPPTYKEWLSSKKQAEQEQINIKKAEEERKRIEEEDRKLQAEIKDKSYEQWLVEKEATNVPLSKATTKPKASLPVTTTSGSTNDIIKNIMKKRHEEDREMTHYELYMEKMKETKTKGSAIYNWLLST